MTQAGEKLAVQMVYRAILIVLWSSRLGLRQMHLSSLGVYLAS